MSAPPLVGAGLKPAPTRQESEAMAKDEIQRMALCMLADYDARTPGELFSLPVDLTIPH